MLAGLAIAAVAKQGAPPDIDALDEVVVTSEKERRRQRGPVKEIKTSYIVKISRDNGVVRTKLTLSGVRQQEVRFRRESAARRLSPETTNARSVGLRAQLSGDRVVAEDSYLLTTVHLYVDANVDEADGLPASIPFSPRASLVNLDYMRLRDTQGATSIGLSNSLYPQTRRCEPEFQLWDEGQESPNGFILVTESLAECQRVLKNRENDLLFADSVPAALRQAVAEIYGPITVRVANKLGSEPGLVYVAWWPDSPHDGMRFERSWNRSSLLLFNGADWKAGPGLPAQESLRDIFAREQIQRRVRQSDWPGVFTESAATYLLKLIRAEQPGNTNRQLTEELPGWIGNCARRLKSRPPSPGPQLDVPNYDCGMVVQFVYDAVARARSNGRENLCDTWRRLLNSSYQRGGSGARPWEFLAVSDEAQRIVKGVLDGGEDWDRFVAELRGLGVGIRIDQDTLKPTVTVLSLTHFRD